MNVWLKIGVPVLLGGVAAWINWWVLQSDLTPEYYVMVEQNIKAGELFNEGKLAKFTIRTNEGGGSLAGVAVRWEQRAVLFDVPAVREMAAKELVLLRDAPSRFKALPLNKNERAVLISLEDVKYEPSQLLVGASVGFVIPATAADTNTKPVSGAKTYVNLGPFRILSVGRRVSPYAEGDVVDATAVRVISVAIQTEERDGVEILDERANRLIEAASVRNPAHKSSIESLVLYPPSGTK